MDTIERQDVRLPAPDFAMMAVQKMVDIPDRWTVAVWEIVNYGTPAQAMQVTGAVCDVVFKSGPRKGRKNWAKRDKSTEFSVRYTERQEKEVQLQWEADTGFCHKCHGNGTAWAGWSAVNGTTYKICRRCAGTGQRPDGDA
jgi:hypothetical protein